jgi:hypothetical protein
VSIGVQSREEDWIGGYETIPIESKVVHPLDGTDGYSNDIMIMKLRSPSDQQYVRLNSNSSLPKIDQQMWVVGFGDTIAGSGQLIPDVLNEVDVNYVTQSACDLAFGNDLIHDDMLCAEEDGKDGW